jgi:C4-dicarboxylate-specific signal transduction histidine kinase
MEFRSHLAGSANRRAVLIAAAVSVIVIFLIDSMTQVGVMVADLYMAVLLMVSRIVMPRTLLVVALGCVLLTVVAYFVISPGDIWRSTSLVNLFVVLATIGAATLILWRNRLAELALRDSRDQLAHIARVTTLGELTASITHEVNQPLAGVVTNAHACLLWLAAQPPNLDEARKALDRVARDGNRAGAVIQRVRAMVKKSPPQLDPIDINDAVREVLALTREEVVRHRAVVETDLSSGLPQVPADRIQVQQVILNLVVNALDAIDADDVGPRKIEVRTGREGASDVRVTVRDSGTGLDPQDLEKVFDAFHTTKPNGMGMGLAISRSIIQAHGGRLWAMPNAPRGAAFHFTLPIRRETAPPVEQTLSAS